jgi:TonB family protein
MLSLVTPVTALSQKRASYGPVVSATLSGLDEEMTELEFMVRHREINRGDYERTKQRLTVRRRFIESTALRSREDRVPEIQVLADDELAALAPGVELNADELQVGMRLGERWRLAAIEHVRQRFFVFEKVSQAEVAGVVPQRKLKPGIDPREVIETIVVREETHETPTPSVAATTFPPPRGGATTEAPPPIANEPVSESRGRDPRLLHAYLPEYTEKAREKKVEGELIVRALLGRDGKIKNVKVEKGLGYGLDDRAVASVKRLGFLPAELDGREVDMTAQIVFDFKAGKVTVRLNGLGAAEMAKGAKP